MLIFQSPLFGFNRWLENLAVAGKSLTLLSSMREYCRQAELEKTAPKEHEGYQFVAKAVTLDKLLKAKHHFWISLAQDFHPFLSTYQTNRPMVPFLASDLEKLLRSIMSRFLKESVTTSAKTFTQLAKIDVTSNDNSKLSKAVDMGIITKREVDGLRKNEQITLQEQRQFQLDCKAFLTRASEKFPVVRFLRCLDPQVMAGPISILVKLFERLLSILLDTKWVRETEVNFLKKEYASFLADDVHGNPKTLHDFEEYDKVRSERIDCFLATYLKASKYQKLWDLVKCLLVLSHGQAGVERGFSINSEIMEYNFKQKSVVALRNIYDHIQTCGGILHVKIDEELRNVVKNSSSEFRREQKRQQEGKKNKEKHEANRVVNDEISSLKVKRKRLLEHCSVLQDSAEKLAERAEKENNMVHLRKSNSFRRTIKDMEKEADEIDDQIETLKKRLKL